MIDFEEYKLSMNPQEAEKLDLALARLKTLAPEARDQILHAMELMIQCDEMRREKMHKDESLVIDVVDNNTEKLDKEKLIKSLKCKYSHIVKLAKMSGEINDYDRLMIAISRILNVGTYSEGAVAIDLLIKINQIHMLLDPISHFKLNSTDMEE